MKEFLNTYSEGSIPGSDSFKYLLMGLIIVCFILFGFLRKQLQSASNKTYKYIFIFTGIFFIIHEFLFDLNIFVNHDYSSTQEIKIGNHMLENNRVNMFLDILQDNLELCRFNMYTLGLAFILYAFNIRLLLGVMPTAFFGGFSTLFDGGEKQKTVRVHTVLTHVLFLSIIPALAITMKGDNYKGRDVMGAFIVNLSFTIFVIIYNNQMGETHSVLAKEKLSDNVIADWAIDIGVPLAFMAGIGAVSVLEMIGVVIHRKMGKVSNKKGKEYE